ncbi:conserved hypothetical protein [Talaromyces stipitatus ATCC 10500]|uniref:Uncharacterized protein n=1 Tax=Talaromyces stipitatus (strain ATCC 10500 / CBS 375.48 / QM 6759 / NRRL 1006) TaxID=441959 RepID=B8MIP9_TALSN|nr:uncharacterized protein TSTA_049990 [Talaromyces stipitatus ATCC 10500]EED15561.1 conserved hypothetical protein [Talaromyces stipitatus ATCC 10500]
MGTNDQLPSQQIVFHDNGDREEIQRELSHILNSIQHDITLQGVLSIGKDGVLRSLTADRKVVDAVGLRPELIKAMLDRMPFDSQNEANYRGVDGTKVSEDQWFHPDKDLLPPPLREERVKGPLSEEQLERNREWLQRRAERKGCPIHPWVAGLKTKRAGSAMEEDPAVMTRVGRVVVPSTRAREALEGADSTDATTATRRTASKVKPTAVRKAANQIEERQCAQDENQMILRKMC